MSVDKNYRVCAVWYVFFFSLPIYVCVLLYTHRSNAYSENGGVIWDRRRRYDLVFHSGETAHRQEMELKIKEGVQLSKTEQLVFSSDEDLRKQTLEAIQTAYNNMLEDEEEND